MSAQQTELKKSFIIKDGLKYQTKIALSVDKANEYMTNNPEWAVLAEMNGQIHLANVNDKGKKLNKIRLS